MRVCPFNGCGKVIAAEMFACGKHWYDLNRGQQKEIYAAYDDWKKGSIDGVQLRARQQAVLDEVQPRKSFKRPQPNLFDEIGGEG